MAVLDEIKKMQQQGKTEPEISQSLQQKGYSQLEISNALSQTQIKQAVTDFEPPVQSQQGNSSSELPSFPNQSTFPPQNQNTISSAQPYQAQTQELQPSLLQQSPDQFSQPQSQVQYQDAYNQPYPQDQYGYDYSYQSQAPSISSDTISEIAEQIVAEKLKKIHTQLEKTSDLKSITETQLSILSDRLQRIEKIIDQLQLSILNKIGEYVTSVSDIKKELKETQKSFSSKKLHPNSHSHHEKKSVHHKTHKKKK
jgi:hypothetical protein